MPHNDAHLDREEQEQPEMAVFFASVPEAFVGDISFSLFFVGSF
jgi:hypothetical protein